jgi:hypothetical protein
VCEWFWPEFPPEEGEENNQAEKKKSTLYQILTTKQGKK